MKSLQYKIYLFLISSEFILLYPLYIVMFASSGLSALQISTLLIIWSVAILLAEIPSGALADRYSRRNLLVIAQLIRVSGYLMWIVFPTFYGFAAGLVLWGIGHAFKSGAFEALVYDELKAVGNEKHYARIMGRGESLSLFFGLGSTLAATPVFIWFGYPGILWGSIIAVTLSAFAALSLPNRPLQKKVGTHSYAGLIHEAARSIARTPSLLKLIVFGVFIGMLFRVFDEYTSLIIKESGISVEWIPITSALVFMPVILIGFIAYRFEKLRGATFVTALSVAGIILIASALTGGLSGLALFSLFLLLLKLTQIIFNSKVQHAIASSTRATVTSFNAFGVEIAAVGGFFLYGLMSQIGGIKLALAFFGGISMGTTLLYFTLAKWRRYKPQKTT